MYEIINHQHILPQDICWTSHKLHARSKCFQKDVPVHLSVSEFLGRSFLQESS